MSGTIFDNAEFSHLQSRWIARGRELQRRAGYYDGSVYKRHNLGWLAPRLYKGVKALYLPLHRAVSVDAGIIPGGWAFPEDAPTAWEDARKLLWSWSSWATDGVLYVHYGAQYGLSGLRVADLRDLNRVVVKPCDPTRFMLVPTSQYDDTPAMAVYIEYRDTADGLCEYAEVIEPDRVRTFYEGSLVGVGGRDAEYVNPLGFVPFVESQHIRTGEPYGECTYQMAIPLLDEVNQLASYLADIIAKNVEPQWALTGVEPSDMVKSGDTMWFLPGGSDAKPLVAGIDIDGVLAFVQTIAGNVKESLPELAFDELRSKDQIATATVELQLMELTLKVKRTRPNYDDGLVKALRMAGRAAATMGLSDIAVLDDELLSLDPERPVIPLDPIAAIDLELKQIELENARNPKPSPAPLPPVVPPQENI